MMEGSVRSIATAVGRSPMDIRNQPSSLSVQLIALAFSLVLCLGAATIGAVATNSSLVDWYPTLAKPPWNPPNWLFGPVWTTLFIGMAVSAWLVWRKRGLTAAWLPLVLFVIQLGLNLLWSVLFFGMRSPGAAFIEIIVLWFSILATLIAFSRISIWAAGLLLPYLAWVTFATALNWTLWSMNS